MKGNGTFFVIMFMVMATTKLGFRYFEVKDDLIEIVVISISTFGILKLIQKVIQKVMKRRNERI